MGKGKDESAKYKSNSDKNSNSRSGRIARVFIEETRTSGNYNIHYNHDLSESNDFNSTNYDGRILNPELLLR